MIGDMFAAKTVKSYAEFYQDTNYVIYVILICAK